MRVRAEHLSRRRAGARGNSASWKLNVRDDSVIGKFLETCLQTVEFLRREGASVCLDDRVAGMTLTVVSFAESASKPGCRARWDASTMALRPFSLSCPSDWSCATRWFFPGMRRTGLWAPQAMASGRLRLTCRMSYEDSFPRTEARLLSPSRGCCVPRSRRGRARLRSEAAVGHLRVKMLARLRAALVRNPLRKLFDEQCDTLVREACLPDGVAAADSAEHGSNCPRPTTLEYDGVANVPRA